jgi:ABC-2 type transport system ATP-binding protein
MLQLKDSGTTVFFSTHILADAEALCDRVAILHKGELRGVGTVDELTSRAQSRVDMVWHGLAAIDAISRFGECHATGETVRATIADTELERALEAVRRAGGRLISVTPVRATLEDYFIEKLSEAAEVGR